MQDYLKPILAFDAAMNGCSAAVLDPATGKAVSDIRPMARGQAEILVPMVKGVIEKSGFAFSDLGLIVTTVGPGAFTGLRIGLSTAKSFGMALDIPVAGVLTTETIAHSVIEKENQNREILVILETKREDFYMHVFGQEKSMPATAMARDLIERYGAEKTLLVCGDGLERLRTECAWPAAWNGVDGYELPDPEVMARMGLEQLRAGVLAAPEPVYLRDADVSQSKQVVRTIASE